MTVCKAVAWLASFRFDAGYENVTSNIISWSFFCVSFLYLWNNLTRLDHQVPRWWPTILGLQLLYTFWDRTRRILNLSINFRKIFWDSRCVKIGCTEATCVHPWEKKTVFAWVVGGVGNLIRTYAILLKPLQFCQTFRDSTWHPGEINSEKH